MSVIVAAYQPGDRIQRVIDSLDQQTLPQGEFETIIVDDGSHDDTFERLTAYAADRPNLRVDRIENSGWASRPRNHGLDLARGEYVLFMDHDDGLYPDALRRGWEYAREHGSDIVSAKEIKSNNVGWGFGGYLENVANAVPDPGITALLPMLPHKFYRRAMLQEHGVRFPEGRRILWEDVYFNVAAYRHARVVSVLADTPVYKWTIRGGNNSSTYGPRSSEYWDRLVDLMTFIDRELAEPGFRSSHRAMLLQQYRVRVVNRFHPLLERADDPQMGMAMTYVRRIQERFVPADWDGDLGSFDRAKSILLRRGRTDLLRQLHFAQSAIVGQATLDSQTWQGDVLLLRATARWTTKDGDPLELTAEDGRLLRRLPRAVERALPREVLDVTDAVHAATALVTVQNRLGREAWALPTTSSVRLEPVRGGRVTPVLDVSTALDVTTAAYGRPLLPVTWDVHVRVTLSDVTNHRALLDRLPAAPAVVHGRDVAVYANTRHALSLDLGHRLRSILRDGRPALSEVDGHVTGFTLPLPGVHVGTEASLEVRLEARRDDEDPVLLPGRLLADATGARLEIGGAAPPGTYTIAAGLAGGPARPTTWLLHVDPEGRVRMTRRVTPPAASARPSDGAAALQDRVMRGLRRRARRLVRRT